MTEKSDKHLTQEVVERDINGRRTLIREGAALLLAGTAMSVSGVAFGDECDRARESAEPKKPGNGSDADAGDSADPSGCGKGAAQISSVINKSTPRVAKVKA